MISSFHLIRRHPLNRTGVSSSEQMSQLSSWASSSQRSYLAVRGTSIDLKIAVWNRTENALPPILDRIVYLGLLVVSPLVLPDVGEISPVDAVSGIPRTVPVLILTGGEDSVARPDEARAILDRVRSHGKLVLFEHAGHMNFPETNPDLYQRSVLGFLHEIR